jgi:hypothetical protein
MRQDRQGLALAVCGLEAGPRCVARRRVAEASDRRGGEGPRERRLAALRAGGASTFPRRCLGACDQAAVGPNILDPRDAGDRRPRVAPHHTPHLADAGDRWAPGSGLGVRRLGRRHDRPCDRAASRVRAVKQGEVDGHTLVHGRSGQPRGDPVAVRVGGDLRPQLRQVGPARGSAARGSGVPPVDASDARGAAADHESPASPRERQRPGVASHRAAARRFCGHRACRVWRCPQGWPA